MKKASVFTSLAFAGATLLAASAARANVYTFDFVSNDSLLTAVGSVDVVAGEVIAMSGTITGTGADSAIGTQTISGVVANPNFPGVATSPDGLWYYDNRVISGATNVDLDGLLFTTAENTTGYWNLYTTGAGAANFWLGELVSGNYVFPGSAAPGTLVSGSISAVPEISSWVMMIAGFIGVGFVGVGRAKEGNGRGAASFLPDGRKA